MDQENKEDYEVHIHISTFTLEDNPTEEINTLELVIVLLT